MINGINWTAGRVALGRKVVGNMYYLFFVMCIHVFSNLLCVVCERSLGGGRNQAVNDATDASFRAGLVMAVAAGNSNNNACNSSPASAPLAYTVMSTANNDSRSTFSSFGPCADIFAPGTGITAAWIGGVDRTNTISGTSMASPHIAGIVAKWWSAVPTLTNAQVYYCYYYLFYLSCFFFYVKHNINKFICYKCDDFVCAMVAQVQQAVSAAGQRDLITNPGAGSPNVLGIMNCATA